MRLMVTRPEADALVLKGELERRGHEVLLEPLLAAEFEPVDPDDLVGAQALVATSRNGLRAIGRGPALDIARDIPVFAVGPGTRSTAQALGFAHVIQGPKGARELGRVIASMADVNGGPIIHLAGETLAFDLAGELQALGFHVHQPVVYRMQPVDRLSPAAIAELESARVDGVILLSPQTAAIYASLIAGHDLVPESRRLMHYCLSEAVARKLEPLGRSRTAVAVQPNLQDMLALIGNATAH